MVAVVLALVNDKQLRSVNLTILFLDNTGGEISILNPLTLDSFRSVMTQVLATGVWLDFLGRVLRDVYCCLDSKVTRV